MQKTEFLVVSWGAQGGGRWDLLCDAFFVFVKQIISWQIILFCVIPKEAFVKDNLYREFNNLTNVNSENLVDL